MLMELSLLNYKISLKEKLLLNIALLLTVAVGTSMSHNLAISTIKILSSHLGDVGQIRKTDLVQ